MRLRVVAFNRLSSGAFRVGKQADPARIPAFHPYENPFLTVAKFARFMGLEEIPAKTVEMFKTDPYYKYCFYKLMKAGSICNLKAKLWEADRKRLVAILADPGSHNDQDVYIGLREYMNNFPLYFPGEQTRRDYEAAPGLCSYIYPLFRAIDQVLDGIDSGRETASRLSQAAQAERVEDKEYVQRANLYKFCLIIFNALVAGGQFTPEQLYT